MHKSLEKFQPYVEQGLVRQVISPCGRLVLWNYTDKCTYDKAWDEVTLDARGTVYEIETGRVVARAFPKFFNFGELPHEKQQSIIKNTNFDVYEKMDGSLGIIYFYDGEWRVNTRGSFTSDQAIKGKEILDEKYKMPDYLQGCTLLVEIIYPENRIIVDYGNCEELVILGSYGKRGLELPYDYSETGMRAAPKKKFHTIPALQEYMETLDHTEEGFVVRFENGERVKFKSAEYLRLARIMSNMSPLAFWEKMEYGKIDREFLEQLPEEFRDECDKIADKLEDQYDYVLGDIANNYLHAIVEVGHNGDVRKALGLYIKENSPKHGGAFFPSFLGNRKALDKYIMKYIKPTGNVLKDI